MQALIKASSTTSYPAFISLVVSNRPQAAGLEKAKKLGVEAICIDHKKHKTRKSFEQDLDYELQKRKVELVCNAGFMRILSPYFVRRWRGRLLNIHPSLLPKYKGLNTHERALAAGEAEHGCTVHFVDEGVDTGQIIAQAKLLINKNDTPQSLAKRVLVLEHELYPKVLAKTALNLQ